MAVKGTTKQAGPNPAMHHDGGGFDVVCTVGSVRFDERDTGDSPFVAACRLIDKAGGSGEYSFPHEGGGTVTVYVPAFGEHE